MTLNRDTFSGICDDIRSAIYLGYLHIPDKAIINYDSLCSVFTFPLCFENINVVDEFPEQRCGSLSIRINHSSLTLSTALSS